MKRFSVLYLLNERYHHITTDDHASARTILEKLLTDKRRKPVGIYDAKTELMEWEPGRQGVYDQASIGDQAKRSTYITTIAQALRRRDSSWQPASEFRKPSLFA